MDIAMTTTLFTVPSVPTPAAAPTMAATAPTRSSETDHRLSYLRERKLDHEQRDYDDYDDSMFGMDPVDNEQLETDRSPNLDYDDDDDGYFPYSPLYPTASPTQDDSEDSAEAVKVPLLDGGRADVGVEADGPSSPTSSAYYYSSQLAASQIFKTTVIGFLLLSGMFL